MYVLYYMVLKHMWKVL